MRPETSFSLAEHLNPHEATERERLADVRRRRDEAADILAETLLDMWLARRQGLQAPQPEGGRHD